MVGSCVSCWLHFEAAVQLLIELLGGASSSGSFLGGAPACAAALRAAVLAAAGRVSATVYTLTPAATHPARPHLVDFVADVERLAQLAHRRHVFLRGGGGGGGARVRRRGWVPAPAAGRGAPASAGRAAAGAAQRHSGCGGKAAAALGGAAQRRTARAARLHAPSSSGCWQPAPAGPSSRSPRSPWLLGRRGAGPGAEKRRGGAGWL